jgi:hypothetical protein
MSELLTEGKQLTPFPPRSLAGKLPFLRRTLTSTKGRDLYGSTGPPAVNPAVNLDEHFGLRVAKPTADPFEFPAPSAEYEAWLAEGRDFISPAPSPDPEISVPDDRPPTLAESVVTSALSPVCAVLSFLLCLGALAALWTARHSDDRHALLPGSLDNGHSLFDPPPHASFHEIVFSPRPSSTAQCPALPDDQHPCDVERPPSLHQVPPDSCSSACFMQLKPLSSFEGGHALRATTWVVPAGNDNRLNIQVGVDALSDATFAARHLLRNVHDVVPRGRLKCSNIFCRHPHRRLYYVVPRGKRPPSCHR